MLNAAQLNMNTALLLTNDKYLLTIRQSHHQHSSHTVTGHHNSGTPQSGHIDAKYSDNVNGHDTLTDFVTFVCHETDNSPQSSQVNSSQSSQHNHLFRLFHFKIDQSSKMLTLI